MSGAGDVLDVGADFLTQSLHDVGLGDIPGISQADPLGKREEPKKREERKAKSKAVREKKAARERIKPIPDPEAGKAEKRKAAGRRRQQRGGRTSTVLSQRETLG